MNSRRMTRLVPVVIRERRNNNLGNANEQAVIDLDQDEVPEKDMSPVESESEVPMAEIENSDSGIDMELNSSDEHEDEDDNGHRQKRIKHTHRHTDSQIHELEAFFRECSNPGREERKELGMRIGLDPKQVKFWFQNKRTQMKSQQERGENDRLRAENQKLREENLQLRHAIANNSCPTCCGEAGPTADELRLENARLKDQIKRFRDLASEYVLYPFPRRAIPNARPVQLGSGSRLPPASITHPNQIGSSTSTTRPCQIWPYGRTEQRNVARDVDVPIEHIHRSLIGPNRDNVPLIIELGNKAIYELIGKAEFGDMFWIDSRTNSQLPSAIWNLTNGWKVEGTRDWAVAMIPCLTLVEAFMNMDKWLALFSNIVSRAIMLEQVRAGNGGTYDGAVQLVVAEYQVLTPIVPTRTSIFARCCKKLSDKIWGIVDVEVDSVLPAGNGPTTRCRRKPSGCLIRDLSNGKSRVTWVEHVEVDEDASNALGRHLLKSTLAYGARRWVDELYRQSERLARSELATNPGKDINELVLESPQVRRKLLELSQRMIVGFCGGITASTAYGWEHVCGDGLHSVRIMIKDVANEPGMTNAKLVCSTLSLWLPTHPKVIFHYLSDYKYRPQWDFLSRRGFIEEHGRISNAKDEGNVLSILRIKGKKSLANTVILQETRTERTSSHVISSPVDLESVNRILLGGPDNVAIFPSGFTIIPCPSPPHIAGTSNQASGTGTLLTAGYQIRLHACADHFGEAIKLARNVVEFAIENIQKSLASRNA